MRDVAVPWASHGDCPLVGVWFGDAFWGFFDVRQRRCLVAIHNGTVHSHALNRVKNLEHKSCGLLGCWYFYPFVGCRHDRCDVDQRFLFFFKCLAIGSWLDHKTDRRHHLVPDAVSNQCLFVCFSSHWYEWMSESIHSYAFGSLIDWYTEGWDIHLFIIPIQKGFEMNPNPSVRNQISHSNYIVEASESPRLENMIMLFLMALLVYMMTLNL